MIKALSMEKANFIGTCSALMIILLACLIFVFRLNGQAGVEYWLGIVFMAMALPLVYLLVTAHRFDRPSIYYIQIAIMILFIIAELLLDYIFKIDFRHTKWMAITYAMLFFAGTGGMIGIASHSGRLYSIIAVCLFFIMTILAFYQRSKTGL